MLERIYTPAATGLLALLVLAVLAAPVPHLHDFGEWAYQGQILVNKLMDPESVSAFVLAPYPVPNSTAVVLLALLGTIAPPVWTAKLFLALLLTAWYLVLHAFVKRHVAAENRGATFIVLVAAVALASYFWWGFVAYQLALLFFFVFLLRWPDRISPWFTAAFGILIFFTHAMVFLAWGALIGIAILLRRLDYRHLLALVPSAFLSVWFLLGRQLTDFTPPTADASMSGLGELLLYKAGSPVMFGPFRNYILPTGVSLLEDLAPVYWSGAVLNMVFVVLIGLFLLVSLFGKGRIVGSIRKSDPALRWTGILFTLTYLITPFNFFGMINPGGRLLLPLFAMVLALAGPVPFRFIRWAAAPALIGAMLSVGAYALLVNEAVPLDQPPPSVESSPPPRDSVLAYHAYMYRHTRYKLFNYRIFAFSNRYERMEEGVYPSLGFRTGPIIGLRPTASSRAKRH